MAYVQDFQKFFISKNNEVELNKNISFERFSSHEEHQNILGQNDILFVDEKSFLRWKYFAKHPSQYNVLIATHSLSELPMEDFLKYYLGLLDDDKIANVHLTKAFDSTLAREGCTNLVVIFFRTLDAHCHWCMKWQPCVWHRLDQRWLCAHVLHDCISYART